MFIFYNVITFSALIKTLINKRKTFLLTVFLSKQAVRDLINSVSRIIIRKISKN